MIDAALAELAQRWGVQTGYWDVSGTWHDTPVDSLMAVLGQLGAPITTPDAAADACLAHRRSMFENPIEPVFTVASGDLLAFELRLPAGTDGRVPVTVVAEDGETHRDVVSLAAVEPHTRHELDGRSWDVRWVVTALALPVGYHRAIVEVSGVEHRATVLAPPPGLPAFRGAPGWGVFAPTYGFVPSGRPGVDHLGIGHIGDLGALAAGLAPLGARVVSTLPLLATFLDEPFEPSPYSPISRRWWGELHLEPTRLPGLADSPDAQAFVGSRRVEAAAADLAAQPLVDHRGAARLMRDLLDTLVADLAGAEGPTAAALERFAADNPELDRYARFRALVEQHGQGWGSVRASWVGQDIAAGDVDPAVVARHRYIQFAADQQLRQLDRQLRSRDQLLALDLPLGANPDGFDVWANPDDYAVGVATGAPPDDLFAGGQNWGFPPVHPITSRARAHHELVQAVRHHMGHSGLLRIDHLMSLERLWWIPDGASARDGVYVRYPTNELMAVIAIEAARADVMVLGENLGTVSDEINATMEQWQMLGMYELQFEAWRAEEQGRISEPAPLTVAGLNTHDMPTFAGWWEGHDIIDSVDLGLVEPGEAPARLDERRAHIAALARVLGRELGTEVAAEPREVLAAALEWLGGTPAQIVLATLEDLWLEERPQNVPGTNDERPNWRRRFALRLSDALDDPTVVGTLEALQRARTDVPIPTEDQQ